MKKDVPCTELAREGQLLKVKLKNLSYTIKTTTLLMRKCSTHSLGGIINARQYKPEN